MSTIKLENLYPTGSDLFSDTESYMTDLTEEELGAQGGAFSTPACAVVSIIVLSAYSVSIIASAAKSNPKSPHVPPKN